MGNFETNLVSVSCMQAVRIVGCFEFHWLRLAIRAATAAAGRQLGVRSRFNGSRSHKNPRIFFHLRRQPSTQPR